MLAGVSCWMSCLVMIDIVMTTWRHPHVCPHQAHYKYSCEIVQISTICHPGSVLGGACAGVRSVWYPVARPGPSHSPTLGRCSDIFIPIFGACLLLSSLLPVLPPHLASHWAEAEVNIRIFPLSVGGTRARCREMSDEWETKGKWECEECSDCQL